MIRQGLLIERSQPEKQDPPCWWNAKSQQWVYEAHKATMYTSRVQAETELDARSGIKGIHSQWGHIEEHVFLDGFSPVKPTGGVLPGAHPFSTTRCMWPGEYLMRKHPPQFAGLIHSFGLGRDIVLKILRPKPKHSPRAVHPCHWRGVYLSRPRPNYLLLFLRRIRTAIINAFTPDIESRGPITPQRRRVKKGSGP